MGATGARRAPNHGLFRAAEGRPAAPVESQPMPGGDATDASELVASLTTYFNEIGRVPLLSVTEEQALAQRVEQGDPEAVRQLWQANLRLVVSIAKRYGNQQLSLLDLIQEGNLGLLRAATRFDWRRGVRFPTYASWWVHQGITQALTRQSRSIRLPARMSETVRRLTRLRHDLAQTLGRDPELSELAEAAAMTPRRVAFALRVAQQALSLDARPEDGEGEPGTLDPPDAGPDLEEQVADHLPREELEQALLALRHRLDGDDAPPARRSGAG